MGVRALILLALACGCRAQHAASADLLVVCASDADCPDSMVCALKVSRCRLTHDDTPPGVSSVSALSPVSVLVVFDEPILSLDGDASFIVTGAEGESLEVSRGELQKNDDGVQTSLLLRTATQVPLRPYALSLAGIKDQAGNAVPPAALVFTGFGNADPSAPTIIAPRSDEPCSALTAHLIWSSVTGASRYRVEIALDPGFTEPVSGSPFEDIESNALSFTAVAPVTHYWRVRADVTTPGDFAQSSFEPVGDVVHVYCAENASCATRAVDASLPPEIGNRSLPFRSVSRALDAAFALGGKRILIAARGGDTAYESTLFVDRGGIDLIGGYSPSFVEAERDPALRPTIVGSVGYAHTFHAISEPTLVEGLVLRNLLVDRYAGLIFQSSTDALVLRDCRIDGVAGAPSSLYVSSANPLEPGPLLERVTIDTQVDRLFDAAIFLFSGRLRLKNSHIQVVSAAASVTACAYHLGADLGIEDSSCSVTANLLGSCYFSSGSLTIAGSSCDIRAASASGIKTSASLSVDRFHFRSSGAPSFAIGIEVEGATTMAKVTNTVIVIDADEGAPALSGAAWIHAKDGSTINVAHATLVNRVAVTEGHGIESTDGTVTITNTLMDCGDTGSALFASGAAAAPGGVRQNAFVRCPLFYHQEDPSTPLDVTLLDDLHALESSYVGNLTSALADSELFVSTSDYHLKADLGPGLDLTVCAVTAPLPCVTHDADLEPRDPPVSIGAYEVP